MKTNYSELSKAISGDLSPPSFWDRLYSWYYPEKQIAEGRMQRILKASLSSCAITGEDLTNKDTFINSFYQIPFPERGFLLKRINSVASALYEIDSDATLQKQNIDLGQLSFDVWNIEKELEAKNEEIDQFIKITSDRSYSAFYVDCARSWFQTKLIRNGEEVHVASSSLHSNDEEAHRNVSEQFFYVANLNLAQALVVAKYFNQTCYAPALQIGMKQIIEATENAKEMPIEEECIPDLDTYLPEESVEEEETIEEMPWITEDKEIPRAPLELIHEEGKKIEIRGTLKDLTYHPNMMDDPLEDYSIPGITIVISLVFDLIKDPQMKRPPETTIITTTDEGEQKTYLVPRYWEMKNANPEFFIQPDRKS